MSRACRQWGYFDDWESVQFQCGKCNWRGAGQDLETGDVFDGGWELCCPECFAIVHCMSSPTHAEVQRNLHKLPKYERSRFLGDKNWRDVYREWLLESRLSQKTRLPDIIAPQFVLKWDALNLQVRIKYRDRIIFREPDSYPGWRRFIEVAEILQAHYGPALRDLIPTGKSLHTLCGDPDEADAAELKTLQARERIFGTPVKDLIPQWGRRPELDTPEGRRGDDVKPRGPKLLPERATLEDAVGSSDWPRC